MRWGTVPEWFLAIGVVVLAWRLRPPARGGVVPKEVSQKIGRTIGSGSCVMPEVHLPEGYEPRSAAVITPRPEDE